MVIKNEKNSSTEVGEKLQGESLSGIAVFAFRKCNCISAHFNVSKKLLRHSVASRLHAVSVAA